jgi:uncharacterized secreted protein with C-terminal beta-propeller domain
VEAGGDDKLSVVSRLRLDTRPTGMYLSGDRLALVSSSGLVSSVSATNWMDQHSTKTVVTVLDVTERAAPKLVQKTEMDGQIVTSRVVNGELRLVLSNQLTLPKPIQRRVDRESTSQPVREPLNYVPDRSIDVTTLGYATGDFIGDFAIDQSFITTVGVVMPGSAGDFNYQTHTSSLGANYVYETLDEYLTRVRDTFLESIGLSARSLGLDGTVLSESSLLKASDLEEWGSWAGRNVTTVATFDLIGNEVGPAAKATVRNSTATEVYATAENIYVFGQQDAVWQPGDSNNAQGKCVSKIGVWKFAFDADRNRVRVVARGEIEGTLLNQFSADEHEGYLRVVTTSTLGGMSVHNLYVLGEKRERLKVVGQLEGIAPGETLHSVRFMGDRGFLVTFERKDPLFALDLSDPVNPKLMGELVIPGVSGYLQPLDETHLLGVGRDADWAGRPTGNLELSIFDVSDLTNPQLLHRYRFESWSITTPVLESKWSTVLADHHALGYFPEEQILAIPIFNSDLGRSDGNDTLGMDTGEGGLEVFRVDVDGGFTPLALLKHDTSVERSLTIGDRLFAISNGKVSMHKLDNPTNQLAEVEIGGESGAVFVELVMLTPSESTTYDTRLASALIETFETRTAGPMETPSLTTGTPTTPVVDPRAGWALPDLECSRHAQPARVAAFENVMGRAELGAELIRLLASEHAKPKLSSDNDGDRHFDDDAARTGEFHLEQHQDISDAIEACVLEDVFASA